MCPARSAGAERATVLGITGIVFARVERLGSFRGTLAVLANLALGVVLIGLKVLVVH